VSTKNGVQDCERKRTTQSEKPRRVSVYWGRIIFGGFVVMEETRKTTMFCLKHTDSKRGTYYGDFYNNKMALTVCYGVKDDMIFTVCVEEAEESAETYWGWWDFEKKRFDLVFKHRKTLGVCFPHGIGVAEEKGQGVALPVKVNENVLRQ
jgi:hypothetical protein